MKNIQLMTLLNKFPFLDFPASSWAMLNIKHKNPTLSFQIA